MLTTPENDLTVDGRRAVGASFIAPYTFHTQNYCGYP
jgi:hypothetical protein